MINEVRKMRKWLCSSLLYGKRNKWDWFYTFLLSFDFRVETSVCSNVDNFELKVSLCLEFYLIMWWYKNHIYLLGIYNVPSSVKNDENWIVIVPVILICHLVQRSSVPTDQPEQVARHAITWKWTQLRIFFISLLY